MKMTISCQECGQRLMSATDPTPMDGLVLVPGCNCTRDLHKSTLEEALGHLVEYERNGGKLAAEIQLPSPDATLRP